ncbi:thioredoxin-dependent thiol peroxidase [Ilyobacter sp.]|uniref:thioredoxin-dependent thiol peroxidase n=1 Tax=Ilyobacter sp. TaxID=3100343 RepID=UPI003563CB1F
MKNSIDFTLPGSNGENVSLSEFKGKNIILYFYPRDNTPGCTREACEFKESYTKFENSNALVLGISKDTIKKHVNFIEKFQLPFILLSDAVGKVCEDYGVWKLKKMAGKEYMGIERSTFLINKEGIILKEWRKVKVAGHVEEVLQFLSQSE